jgi:hypothetical protein
MGVDQTPKTLHIGIPHTVDNVQHDTGVMNQLLSQTFREILHAFISSIIEV